MHLTDASGRIRRTAFRRLLAGGAPVVPAEVLAELDISDKEGEPALRDLEAGGRIRLAENGDIVGSAGLSVVPSRHRLRIEKRWLWTWCAWDAVGILGALRASGAVRSRDPLGGEPIEVIFSGGVPEPNEAVVFRAVDEGYLSKHDEYCPLTNLFHDGTAAPAWADKNGIRGTVLAVQQASIEAALDWRPLVVDLLLHP